MRPTGEYLGKYGHSLLQTPAATCTFASSRNESCSYWIAKAFDFEAWTIRIRFINLRWTTVHWGFCPSTSSFAFKFITCNYLNSWSYYITNCNWNRNPNSFNSKLDFNHSWEIRDCLQMSKESIKNQSFQMVHLCIHNSTFTSPLANCDDEQLSMTIWYYELFLYYILNDCFD